jgi:hypothetical protein
LHLFQVTLKLMDSSKQSAEAYSGAIPAPRRGQGGFLRENLGHAEKFAASRIIESNSGCQRPEPDARFHPNDAQVGGRFRRQPNAALYERIPVLVADIWHWVGAQPLMAFMPL